MSVWTELEARITELERVVQDLRKLGSSKTSPVENYQTRRNSGELRHFFTFQQAFVDAQDPEVWKISWELTDPDSPRIRLIRESYETNFHLELI